MKVAENLAEPPRQCARCGSKSRLEWAWIQDEDDGQFYCSSWCIFATHRDREAFTPGNNQEPQ